MGRPRGLIHGVGINDSNYTINKAKKREYACILAGLQTNKLVADALRRRYE